MIAARCLRQSSVHVRKRGSDRDEAAGAVTKPERLRRTVCAFDQGVVSGPADLIRRSIVGTGVREFVAHFLRERHHQDLGNRLWWTPFSGFQRELFAPLQSLGPVSGARTLLRDANWGHLLARCRRLR